MAELVDESGVTVFKGTIKGGGSQLFVLATLQHSADFSNLAMNAPVVAGVNIRGALTLPPTAFGNDGQVSVTVENLTAVDLGVGGGLIVQNADGTVWIEQDRSTPQLFPAGLIAQMDFDASGGGAGAGLSWNAASKQVDIANAGAYSAVVNIFAQPV